MSKHLMEKLLSGFDDAFAEPRGLLPPRARNHRIHLRPGMSPAVVQPCRYPTLQKDDLERQCAAMME